MAGIALPLGEGVAKRPVGSVDADVSGSGPHPARRASPAVARQPARPSGSPRLGVCLAPDRSCSTSGGSRRSGALPVLIARTSTRLAGSSAKGWIGPDLERAAPWRPAGPAGRPAGRRGGSRRSVPPSRTALSRKPRPGRQPVVGHPGAALGRARARAGRRDRRRRAGWRRRSRTAARPSARKPAGDVARRRPRRARPGRSAPTFSPRQRRPSPDRARRPVKRAPGRRAADLHQHRARAAAGLDHPLARPARRTAAASRAASMPGAIALAPAGAAGRARPAGRSRRCRAIGLTASMRRSRGLTLHGRDHHCAPHVAGKAAADFRRIRRAAVSKSMSVGRCSPSPSPRPQGDVEPLVRLARAGHGGRRRPDPRADAVRRAGDPGAGRPPDRRRRQAAAPAADRRRRPRLGGRRATTAPSSWPPRSSSSTPPPCCTTTWSTAPSCAAARSPPT